MLFSFLKRKKEKENSVAKDITVDNQDCWLGFKIVENQQDTD